MMQPANIDPMMLHRIDWMFQSEQDRLENATKKKLKGVGRQLYLEKRVKLSNVESLMESSKGLSTMKLKVKKEENEDE